MGRQQALRLKELEKENVRLPQMYANLSLQYDVLSVVADTFDRAVSQ